MPDEVRDSFCQAEHRSTGVSLPRRTSFPDPVARPESFPSKECHPWCWILAGSRPQGLSFSPDHQSSIQDDAREPGPKRGSAFEGAQVKIGRQQGILNCVLGVFLISQDGVGQRDESRTRGEEHLLDRFPLVANRLSGSKSAGRVTGRAAGVWPNVIVPPSGTVEAMVCCSGAGTFTALRRYR